MCPIGLVGPCSPDFQGDVAARASTATGVPFTLSTFSQAPMEEVIKHAGATPNFFQLCLPAERELAGSLISRAKASGYSALVVTVDSWTLGFRPVDLERGNFPQFRGFCMENGRTACLAAAQAGNIDRPWNRISYRKPSSRRIWASGRQL